MVYKKYNWLSLSFDLLEEKTNGVFGKGTTGGGRL